MDLLNQGVSPPAVIGTDFRCYSCLSCHPSQSCLENSGGAVSFALNQQPRKSLMASAQQTCWPQPVPAFQHACYITLCRLKLCRLGKLAQVQAQMSWITYITCSCCAGAATGTSKLANTAAASCVCIEVECSTRPCACPAAAFLVACAALR